MLLFVCLFLVILPSLSRFAHYRFVSNIIMTSVRAAGLIDGYERTITGRVFTLARVSRNEPTKKSGTSIMNKSFPGVEPGDCDVKLQFANMLTL